MENEQLPRTDIYRAIHPALEVVERDGDTPTLLGKFSVFDRWTEIDSAVEGHFMERIAPGAFKKTISENIANIKVLLSHGKDPSIGQMVLGSIESLREDADAASYKVALFRSVPQLLVDGLRAGVYGASFRADALKNDVVFRPKRSEHNPEGIMEVTRTELRLKDIGPTPFAQYAETTSVVRSTTDELVFASLIQHPQIVRSLLEQGAAALDQEEEPEPERDAPVAEATTPLEDEPQHSAENVHEEVREEEPEWLLP